MKRRADHITAITVYVAQLCQRDGNTWTGARILAQHGVKFSIALRVLVYPWQGRR